MKNICDKLKKLMMNSTLHSLVLALTALYLMFGVMNAGFIMVQVVASMVDFFFNHSSTHGDIIHMWNRTVILR
jgi:membrane-bound ClpP family serine protease